MRLSATYAVDLRQRRQYRIDDPDRWRAVQRRGPGQQEGDDEGDGDGEEEDAAAGGDGEDDEEYREDEDEEEEEEEEEAAGRQRKRPTRPRQQQKKAAAPAARKVEEKGAKRGKGKEKPAAAPAGSAPAAKGRTAGGTARAAQAGSGDGRRDSSASPAPASSPSSSSASAVRVWEEEKRRIVADYEAEIEALQRRIGEGDAAQQRLQTELEAAREEKAGRQREAEAEHERLRAEHEQLQREHERLLQQLEPVISIIGSRRAAGSDKRQRGSSSAGREEAPKRPQLSASAAEEATQALLGSSLLSPTLVLDGAESFSSAAASAPATAFRGLLERHLVNRSTLQPGIRPLCACAVGVDQLLIGYTAGRLELWDLTDYRLLCALKEQQPSSSARRGKQGGGQDDDAAKADSENVYCVASLGSRDGQRLVAAGRGRHLLQYALTDDGLQQRRKADLGQSGFVSCCCLLRDGLLAVGVSGSSHRIALFELGAAAAGADWKPKRSLAVRSPEVRQLLQLHDGRLAVAGCSSLQRAGDRDESGAVELWSRQGDDWSRAIIASAPAAAPDVGLRCNGIALLPTDDSSSSSSSSSSSLLAAYEWCSTGDRALCLHHLTAADSSTLVVEKQHSPSAAESSYTAVAAAAVSPPCALALTYGGVLLLWRRQAGGGGDWQRERAVKVEQEPDAEVDESAVLALPDGRILITAAGNVKVWH